MLRRRPAPRRAPARAIDRAADGALSDPETGPVTLDDLRADLQAGRYFRARRSDTGADCTNEVLAELIQQSVPEVDALVSATNNPLLRLLGGLDARS